MKLGCSYFGNRILKHVREDMRDLREMGCTYVVHTFNENDLIFYHKTMCEIVAATQELGMEVHIDPWGVGKVFGGESFSNFVMQNSDSVQHASDGKPVGCACPNAPKFRAFMREWIDAAVATGAEVIFWDEPHFYICHWIGGRPDTWGCLCAHCRSKFEARFGRPMPAEQDEDVKQLKDDSLHEFLAEIVKYAASKGVRNSLCVLPHRGAQQGSGTWERLAGMPGLSIFGSDPYWEVFKEPLEPFVGGTSREVKKICAQHKLDPQMWLQGYGFPSGREHEIVEAVDVMLREGIRDIAVWGFDACRHLSWIRPADPDLVWTKIKEAYARALRAEGRPANIA